MKKLLPGSLCVLALLFVVSTTVRADEFDRIASSPATYWVPAPTPPPPGYAYAPPPGPPPPPVVVLPRFFIGFHFH